ncbi:nicotinate-nucleotide--dimethylbenzimidazole phosphoribosyltransferase [Halomarina pelagica]|uniref:nicotinate-nucleotide--dimethylbenzimidazole phosphoribosyltransferase n=1 Tax=Halomarina pelagica TaxID=2961599 RepID=UPI0020C1FFB4|nr:nicotinate-nucleotide--dimethylbenzimidazole phosphoribosyltransferase [Halomarina sp. BND7]
MRLVLVAGATEVAAVEGISAAGAHPALMRHTPSADAEILTYGAPVTAPDGTTHPTPVSPEGCPTPAVMTRAAREVLGFDATVVDAGLAAPTGAPVVSLGAEPGRDVRAPVAVPDADGVFDRARRLGRSLPGPLVLAETIPGGTTTALGTLTALGRDAGVSSSLPENPLELKREVVASGLDASGLEPGDAADDPLLAVRAVGDPVLAGVAGLAVGALDSGTEVVLGGGTQMLAAAAVARGFTDGPLELATTSFVADSTPDLRGACAALDLDPTITDPGFTDEHVATRHYLAGVGKEGVGMGGALALAAERGALPAVRDRIRIVYDRLLAGGDAESPAPAGRDAGTDDGP